MKIARAELNQEKMRERAHTLLKTRIILGDRIKGLQLRHFGKLNIAYHGKLRRRSSSTVAALYMMVALPQ